MENLLSKRARALVVKTTSVFTGMTTIMSLSGLLYFAPVASAVAPADYGLKEGDTVSAAGSSDPDIYIVNDYGYKRLFLNPVIFNFYAHLGWSKVKTVSSPTRDAFTTSGLFRNCETNDEKVYGVETTGEDTGMLHWVNTTGAQAVADDANFFKKVFCVNSNEFNWYSKGANYTSVSQVPDYKRGGTTTVPGAVTLSLASGNPAAATVTKNAQGVEFLRVKLSGSGTVNEMTVKRLGAGDTADFDNLYWYEGAKRLTSGKTLSSSTGEVTFANLSIKVDGSKELSLVGDLSATGGNVNYFQLNSVKLSSGSVSGLPLNGNLITVSGSNGGTITMDKVGSLANPTVGQKSAQLSEFKITANTEAASVKRVTLLQGGTVKPADITNIKLKAGTTEWSGTIDSAGYLVFDMGAGFVIAKGGDQVFKVFGDLAGKKDEDINLYFENATDILAVGDQYGFGMAATITSMDTAGEAFDVTLQGGVLTISFNGPTASNIGTDTADTVLLKFSMAAASNIEIRKTEFTLCHDPGGDTSFANSADTTNGWADLDDFKVVNEDTGVTVLGPQDGSAFTVSDPAGGTCEDSVTGAQKSFTDTFELSAGQTANFKVTADIKTANSRSGTALASGDAIQVYLDNYTDDTPDVTIMKYSGTNTAVADADIVPQSDMAGPAMTINSSSLTLGRSTSVISQTVVRGSKDVKAAALNFTAGAASDMKVTDVVLSGYARDATSGNYTLGSEGSTGISVANLVSQVKLYDGETLLSATPASNQLSNTTGTVTFNNLSWSVPAGATKTLTVKVDLSSNPTSASGNDYFAFDIAATGDVTSLDSASKTVNGTSAGPNGTTSPSTAVTVANSGSVTTAVHSNTPAKHGVYWGQTGDVAGIWRISATNEGQLIENLLFAEDDSGQQSDLTNNAKTAYLIYKNKAGTELTATSTFTGAGSASFGFTGNSRPYVPKDGSLDLTLKIDYKTKAEGATSTAANDSTSPLFDIALMTAVDTNTTFKAIGEGSGVVINGGDSGLTTNRDQNANTVIYVYRAFPEFALVAPTATALNTVDPVLRFTITAKGLSDSKLLFDNVNNASGSIKFEVIASGVGSNDVAVTFRDAADSSIVDTETITSATVKAINASLTMNFSNKDIEISGGSSKTFTVTLDSTTNFSTPINTSAGVGADFFQLVLQDNEAALINWVDNSDTTANSFDVPSVTGVLRLLPMNGYQFKAN